MTSARKVALRPIYLGFKIQCNIFGRTYVFAPLSSPMTPIGVRDQCRLGGGGGGLRSVPRIFSPLLAENQVVLPEYYMFLLPENCHFKNSQITLISIHRWDCSCMVHGLLEAALDSCIILAEILMLYAMM